MTGTIRECDRRRRHREGLPVSCLCPVPLQQGRTGCGWTGLRGYRDVWGAAMAWRTGACYQAANLSTVGGLFRHKRAGPGPSGGGRAGERRSPRSLPSWASDWLPSAHFRGDALDGRRVLRSTSTASLRSTSTAVHAPRSRRPTKGSTRRALPPPRTSSAHLPKRCLRLCPRRALAARRNLILDEAREDGEVSSWSLNGLGLLSEALV
jgi:hypothetical protein